MKKIMKKALGLLLCAVMVLTISTTAYAGSATVTTSVRAVFFNYTATATARVTSSSYYASTSYGTNANLVYVNAIVVQKNKSTGAKLSSSNNIVSTTTGTQSAIVSGTASSNRVFYSLSSTHRISTFATTWTTSMKVYV